MRCCCRQVVVLRSSASMKLEPRSHIARYGRRINLLQAICVLMCWFSCSSYQRACILHCMRLAPLHGYHIFATVFQTPKLQY